MISKLNLFDSCRWIILRLLIYAALHAECLTTLGSNQHSNCGYPGNRIVIDHGNNEYSVLGHLKEGSIVLKVNDPVDRGQLLGLRGNNGHSSEPHIHYHLQNASDIDNGDGLPVRFYSYLSNGRYIDVG